MSVIYNVTVKPTKKTGRYHITWHHKETGEVNTFEREAEITPEEYQMEWMWPQSQLSIGEKLYRFLDGETHSFQQALDRANRQGKKLQLHLRTCKETTDWPFELLAKDGSYLLLQQIHLVRIASEGGKEEEQEPQNSPLSVLFMAASALGVEPELDFEREEEAAFHITEKLPVHIEVEESGTLEGLCGQLKGEEFDVIHLSGHAGIDKKGSPYFVMEDETGNPHNVSPGELWQKALIHKPPRLLFLSGSRTGEKPKTKNITGAQAHRAETSFSRLLVENNQVPVVLGWGRAVSDEQAGLAGRILFKELSRGRTVLEAVQRARLELTKTFPSTDKPAWPLLRLFSSGMGMKAVVKEEQRWRPKPRQMKHVFLANSRVKILEEGFVGRRRQLQTALRTLKQNTNKVGVLILGTGGLGK
ncbi:MAG: CHAT domain-containing protein, partial [bacterium]|nr:CHAT domain-containing protein [bacterium]